MVSTGGKEPELTATPDEERKSDTLDFRLLARRTCASSTGFNVAKSPPAIPRERLLKALELEQRGFLEEAIVRLRSLHEEIAGGDDPRLAISVHYSLASLLALRGEVSEARALAEDGVLLAWEHSAREELELLDALVRRLPEQEDQ